MTNTQTRIISAICIGIIFLTAIFLFRPLFYIIMYFVAAIMLLEWYKMTKNFTAYKYLGLLFIPTAITSLLLVSSYDLYGWILLTYFSIIWTVDTMAMVGGKLLKGPKLAPTLSPKKTFSGLLVGTSCGAIVPYILKLIPTYNLIYFTIENNLTIFMTCFIFALIAQGSDLFVSFFKRKSQIKDSGSVIPGHGGMLDRFDSIIFTAPLLFLYLNSNV
jgi:phosphatidate cytidylyltransferase